MSINLQGIDWTAPATEIVDELAERYSAVHPYADIYEVEEFTDRVFTKRAQPLADKYVGKV